MLQRNHNAFKHWHDKVYLDLDSPEDHAKLLKVMTGESDSETVRFVEDYKISSDELEELEPEDDAAHVNMGGNWCTPTSKQFHELFENTENNTEKGIK